MTKNITVSHPAVDIVLPNPFDKIRPQESAVVGRIEQLTFTEKDRQRDFVVVDKTGKQLAAEQWLENQIAFEKPNRTIRPNFPQELKFNADQSLSLDAIDNWLATIPADEEMLQVYPVITHLAQLGSDSQAVMVLDRYREHVERRQFQLDCEAECTACGKPDKYYPAVLVEEDNTYQHKVIATGKMEHCDAVLLFFGREMKDRK